MDLTRMAQTTHEMQYANELYKVLHDLDYFLLRYGIEDVGQYTADAGTVGTYYGVLAVYGAEPFSAEEQTKAFGKILWDAYCFGKSREQIMECRIPMDRKVRILLCTM